MSDVCSTGEKQDAWWPGGGPLQRKDHASLYGCKAVTDVEVAAAVTLMRNYMDPATHSPAEIRELSLLLEGLEFQLAAKLQGARQARYILAQQALRASISLQNALQRPLDLTPTLSSLSLPSRHPQSLGASQPAPGPISSARFRGLPRTRAVPPPRRLAHPLRFVASHTPAAPLQGSIQPPSRSPPVTTAQPHSHRPAPTTNGNASQQRSRASRAATPPAQVDDEEEEDEEDREVGKDPIDITEQWRETLFSYDPEAHPLHSNPEAAGVVDRVLLDMSVCGDGGLLYRFPEASWTAVAEAAQRSNDPELVEKLVRPLLIVLGLQHDDVVGSKYREDNHASWLTRCNILMRLVLGLGGRKGTLRAYVSKGVTLIKDMMEHHSIYLEVLSGSEKEKFQAGHLIINAPTVGLFFRRMEAGRVVQFHIRTKDTLSRPTFKTWMVCTQACTELL